MCTTLFHALAAKLFLPLLVHSTSGVMTVPSTSRRTCLLQIAMSRSNLSRQQRCQDSRPVTGYTSCSEIQPYYCKDPFVGKAWSDFCPRTCGRCGGGSSAPSSCCDRCSGSPYCSPNSGNCYSSQNKPYYRSCGGGQSSCCSACSGSPYCSPNSGNCYSSQNKPYYRSCGGGNQGGNTGSNPGGGGTQIKVLSYNLFWWNLFRQRRGNGNSAGKLISANGPYDIMGFQECEDVQRVLRDSGLQSSHGVAVAAGKPLNMAIAYKRSAWRSLGAGNNYVARDRPGLYGDRGVNWARLQHIRTGKVVLFVNHHGPLPVDTGGETGPEQTANNIFGVIDQQKQNSILQILVGDLNAGQGSRTQKALQRRLQRTYGKWVDAIFSSKNGFGGRALGKGGSDHDAIEASFQI